MTLYRLLLNNDRMLTPDMSENVTEQLTHNGFDKNIYIYIQMIFFQLSRL